MADVIYILTNEAMPGLIKIGKTKAHLLKRIKALDTTGVPLPFECFYAAEVASCDSAERLIHDAFDDHRVRKNREFFEISPERAASALKLATIKEVTPHDDIFQTKEDSIAVAKVKERRSRFNFKMVDIPAGSILLHNKDETETCQVVDNRTVIYDDIEQSLSQAALTVFHKLGYTWSAVSGPESWMFEGETLDARRKRLENED
ncbi:hypothetical protein GCM10007939_09490 [Amylibacter marinus]|uniref:Bacteriophage T5 Orf172 DNA-binding domain-containing protein n=1 Tax=Amylibacter marinus TaxID=1475483 RepID=A0ABQ5VTG3_9RHOB|nr:GIY-YIG nuclease family protein [Amylibacter marinus]GLQ34666.1 hypothetical protein GCM10007939_09490 [Amylibacter marinus]